MVLRRIKPIRVQAQPPLTPIKTSMEEIERARQIGRRIAKGRR